MVEDVIIPRVSEVYPDPDRRLRVIFDNGVEKIYDCKLVIERFNFQPLRNESFFKLVHVDPGGYGISWNADIDLSEYELWTNGTLQDK
jgi:hypothetical protein